MTDAGYVNRQHLEMFTWPELMKPFKRMAEIVMLEANNLPRQLRSEAFTMASVAAGCMHCQSHGAYSLHLLGVSPDRIRDIWSFEQSGDFTEAEKAALRLARDAALVPPAVEPGHFAALREHYSDREIVELLAVISLAGWYNRWNNAIATVTDQESIDWARQNLTSVGWQLGKHAGEPSEQRRKHPRSTHEDRLEY
jgi:alkylhydroperoxidase family enzyme